MQVVWAKETKDDFRRFDDFLGELNPDAARRAVEAIRQGTLILIDNPKAGTSLDDGSGRRELFVRFGQRGYVLLISRILRQV